VNVISSQQQLLADALVADGWKIVERATNLAHWAYYEVWTIESIWRPIGRQAFVVFLVDPQRSQQRDVWGVECTGKSPFDSGSSPDLIARIGITHWDRGVVELVESLRRFRND